MPRPKGSKNKQKEQLVEFDYEKMDDSAYSSLMSMPHKNAEEIEKFDAGMVLAKDAAIVNTPVPTMTTLFGGSMTANAKEQDLFLIEGRVRLDQIGAEEPIFSDQKRLVWASDFNEAVGKFSNYFRGLSNQNQRYSVVAAGGTEAIR